MSTSKQNPQIKRSKHLLQNAFLELLGEKPYKKITITDIVNRAEFSRTTFYSHYRYKEDIIEEYLDGLIETIVYDSFGNLTVFPPSHLEDRTRVFRLVKHWQDNASLFQLLQEAGLEKVILSKFKEKQKKFFQEKVSSMLPFSTGKALLEYYLVFISSTQTDILQYWLSTKMEMPTEKLSDFLSVVNDPKLFLKLSKMIDE